MIKIVHQTPTVLTTRHLPVSLWVLCSVSGALLLWGLTGITGTKPELGIYIVFMGIYMSLVLLYAGVWGKVVTCSFDKSCDRVTLKP